MASSAEKLNIPGPEVGYTDLIDYVLDKEELKFDTYPLRPSAAGHCARKLAYDLMEHEGKATYPPEEREPSVKRLLSLGHSIEYHALRYFHSLTNENEEIKVKYKQQLVEFFKLPSGRIIEGSNDFAVKWGDEVGVGDIKSAKDSFDVAYRTKWDGLLEKLSEMKSTHNLSETAFWVEDLEAFVEELNDPFFAYNFWQLNGYCMTPFFRRHKVTHGFIYRYSKNDSRHLEIRFRPNKAMYKKLYDKFKAIDIAVNKHSDPERVPKDYNLGSVVCAFCRYKKECHGDIDAKKEYYKTLPNKKWPKDLDRVPGGLSLEKLFQKWEGETKHEVEAKKLHDQLVTKLEEKKLKKVRLSNGHVYELKALKTGGVANGPRLIIRRSKL